jgi:hypothetical protein
MAEISPRGCAERQFQGRQRGDFTFHENISRHGNHEGFIVDESAGHTAGTRANRASMSGALEADNSLITLEEAPDNELKAAADAYRDVRREVRREPPA